MPRKAFHKTPLSAHPLSEEFRLFWLFRTFQGGGLLIGFVRNGEGVPWAPYDADFGVLSCGAYICITLAMAGLSFLHRVRADSQLLAGAALDLVFANLVLYAAPGATGMVSMLLLSNVAGSALFVNPSFGFLIALLSGFSLFAHRWLDPVNPSVDGPSSASMPFQALVYFSLWLAFVAFLLGRVGDKLFTTDRLAKRRGEEITDLSALNQQILKRLPTGVIVVDGQGDIQASNEVALELMQIPATQGRRSLAIAAPQMQARLREWIDNPLRDRTPVVMGPDSRQIEPQFLRLHPDSDEVLVFLEDTSQAAKRAESITLATLGRFSASLAHEIRNPLSAIKYSSQLLGESSNLDVMDRRMLDIIQQQIQRMNGIIDSVLGLARREEAKPEDFDLAQMLRDFVAEYVAGFPLDSDTLDLQAPDSAVHARADPKQVHQILMVLVSNARYYGRMPQQPAAMILRLRAEGSSFYIDVIDHGPGIPEQAQKGLFRPFFTTSSHGTGLGLYIARELARANGGELQYLRRANGSCFRLTLPSTAAR